MSYTEGAGEQSSFSNEGYNNLSIIQIRLDTTQILKDIKNYLKGKRLAIGQNTDGSYYEKEEASGIPLLNEQGVQSILSYMSGLINSSVVQGNYTKEQYLDHLDRIHGSITRQIIINRESWSLAQENMELVCDYLLNLIEPYMSRLIENKERDSFASTMRIVENNSVKEGKNFSLNPFR